MTPHYIPFYNYQTMAERISKLPASAMGGIYRVFRKDKYAQPVALKLSGYVHPDFHPHGISVVASGDDTFLYVVNHRRDGEFLSVFKLDMDRNELQYWTSITAESFRVINNVAVDPNGHFYYTNWMSNDPGSWTGLFETFGDGKLSQVQYCAVPADFLRKRPSKNVQAACETVVDQVPCNGISFNADFSKLFVVSGSHLLGYHVDPNNPTVLTEYATINTIFVCDNVNPSGSQKNIMYVGCFPRPLSLLFQVQSEPHARIAGMIRKVYIDEKRSELFKLDTNGTKLSAATSAIYYKGYTVAVSYFDDSRYMVCDDVHRNDRMH
eukprot:CAMPEP_0202694174 /NCGR_PEP_ID=MMETSP1385-20130828/8102_1 /ASSEMBLY_ACC=CAM_ASM_000861 /TAXON_ID=933848 /ORGANISM="Elphidium margaritaceum" /LENGTH=322 /DNA_ID=CAMNT_0049349973 /DNA_START=255 /DNA_END=1223 /DNA_ORIENTATION=-